MNSIIHYSIYTSTVSFPHTTKTRLTTYIPNLDKTKRHRRREQIHFSHTLIVTFPLVIFLILKPTVGIISSEYWPDAIKLTNVVLPEFCKPTSVNSISSFQNKLLNQSKIRCTNANILVFFSCLNEKSADNNKQNIIVQWITYMSAVSSHRRREKTLSKNNKSSGKKRRVCR